MQKHFGACHCGKVKFEVALELKNALSCNCSICLKRGSLLDFAPESEFKLMSGENDLQEYLFNKKAIHHQFCKHCGILPFAKALGPDGTKMVAINVRCIDGIDLNALTIQPYDGKSL